MSPHAEQDAAYIAGRIIDCCLRENVRGLFSQGAMAVPPARVAAAWPNALPRHWWRIDHLPDGRLWLPVREDDFMQTIRALGDGWLLETEGSVTYETGSACWMEHLARGMDPETQALHRRYAEEAACAIAHRREARRANAEQREQLALALTHADWPERALLCERIGSYRDHPFYPTARAKSGFSEVDLRAYAPEFAPQFALHWLAVPRDQVTLTTPTPAFWPRAAQLGLPAALDRSHRMLPVHPLTWSSLNADDLPAGSQKAPLAWLPVRPTLSVRTVMPLAHPHLHIKLPLRMSTLGSLNLRLIKPSTLYDGHWFEQVLVAVAAIDPALRERYLHVDEAHGGHVGEARHLAYLVRRYPILPESTLVPVAALCGEMPDGRPLAMHLAARFHAGDPLAWWGEYTRLLCEVHLRLWLRWGIALEANQQNAVLVYQPGTPLRLLMKDNDSARVLPSRLYAQLPGAERFGPLNDARIVVDSDDALARMFCTITLQLGLLAVLEGVAEYEPGLRAPMYAALRDILRACLRQLAGEGIDIAPAERLLASPRLPVKYLLSAGSLLSKAATGAADINKFYGDSAPNFMLADIDAPTARIAG
ncbi:IucA/IucC family protein [Rhodanobacter sp. Col0626]|uniref:IucA/IucC family protein n=1 Tax=Rhodanobacter sp. Col0626 TaxID=3415679 RepID=UPI003CF5C5E6